MRADFREIMFQPLTVQKHAYFAEFDFDIQKYFWKMILISGLIG